MPSINTAACRRPRVTSLGSGAMMLQQTLTSTNQSHWKWNFFPGLLVKWPEIALTFTFRIDFTLSQHDNNFIPKSGNYRPRNHRWVGCIVVCKLSTNAKSMHVPMKNPRSIDIWCFGRISSFHWRKPNHHRTIDSSVPRRQPPRRRGQIARQVIGFISSRELAGFHFIHELLFGNRQKTFVSSSHHPNHHHYSGPSSARPDLQPQTRTHKLRRYDDYNSIYWSSAAVAEERSIHWTIRLKE